MANDLLTTLRHNMKEKHIDALYVPTADPHQTEYVGEHYQTRTFLTGFTGSAGTAVVTENDALLWTDGRYFIQAEREIEPAGFSLMKMATPGYPTVIEWLTQHMPEEATLAFNGQLLSQRQYAVSYTHLMRAVSNPKARGNWERSIGWFLTGQGVSQIGSGLVQFAVIWYVATKTGSGSAMTAVIVASFVPQLLVALFAGRCV